MSRSCACHVFLDCPAFHQHCPCSTRQKLSDTHSFCIGAHACCLRACVEGRATVGDTGLAGCCIIFGRVAPSLWRASLKSTGSLPLPRSGSGSQAKPSSADPLATAAAAAAQNPAGPVAGTRPSNHSTTLHTDGWAAHWHSLVFSKWIRGIPRPSLQKTDIQGYKSCIRVCTAKSVLWVL